MLHKLNSFLKESFALYFVNKVRVFILGRAQAFSLKRTGRYLYHGG
jgi:hypothetical protein